MSSYELIVTDGIGAQVASFDLPLSGFGTIHGQYTIPDSAQPGDFRISDPNWNSNVCFLVTEYRKPEINLQVTAQAEEILNGVERGGRSERPLLLRRPGGQPAAALGAVCRG